MKPIIECVPNFSEGQNKEIITQITRVIEETEGVSLLNVDPGAATNRTVVTFVGSPDEVIEAAFKAIKKAAELIDMSQHKGEHPRMGATDVCPLIPISGITMEETAKYAEKLGERVGRELNIPVYLYEAAAKSPDRKNLATIRAGEYEGFFQKITEAEWKPDYGPAVMNAQSGATVIGARDFLVAYNVNLNTTSERKANSVAFDIREAGRVKKKGDTILRDEQGEALREPGKLKSVKGIGWFIEEYGIAQVSMNLTKLNETTLHEAFEACCESANARGLRVTGSELVGLVPKNVMLEAGRYFLRKQGRSTGLSEKELIFIAVKSMGLDELAPFDANERVIEYKMQAATQNPLVAKTLVEFADTTASESPAPGGGSVSAYVGALGAALGTMVANLSAGKKGWEKQIPYFSEWADKGQTIKDRLVFLVDEDTRAFNGIITAVRMPKSTDEEKEVRKNAMREATRYAIHIPLEVMKTASEAFDLIDAMVKKGNVNSISDAGVGGLCLKTAIYGAYLNVKINCNGFDDLNYVNEVSQKADELLAEAIRREKLIVKAVEKSMQ
ncbi:MAG: glutamate formimidoyltransferase [Saprospiraceae bacterium]|jgi:glutamate formiminotransferase/formiminotetrahydrofolate cyclodeaminase|nr:glutamate formimidoyltransferase [Saprospiraceae bacterium]MBP9194938.1 glutamate formimidoyltransferase [Saprospiraceae bacterium]